MPTAGKYVGPAFNLSVKVPGMRRDFLFMKIFYVVLTRVALQHTSRSITGTYLKHFKTKVDGPIERFVTPSLCTPKKLPDDLVTT